MINNRPEQPLTVVVTGGARGIGSAFAAGLLEEGYNVVVADVAEPSEQFHAASANAHPDKAQASLQEFTEIDPELAEQMVFPAWPTKVNTDSVEFQVELAEQWGLIDSGSVTADELIRAA